jgi:type IV secretion system protein VirB10
MSHGRRSILRFAPSAERRSHAGKRRDLARARYRADRGMTPSKRNTALIFAGTAMVLGILWVNSGRANRPPIVTSPPRQGGPRAARYRGAGNRRLRGGRAAAETARRRRRDPNAPVLNPAAGVPGPDGQIVPAMQPGRGAEQERAPGQPGRPGATIDTHRLWRARSRWGDSQGPAAAASGEPTENSGTPGSTEGRAPNALDF